MRQPERQHGGAYRDAWQGGAGLGGYGNNRGGGFNRGGGGGGYGGGGGGSHFVYTQVGSEH